MKIFTTVDLLLAPPTIELRKKRRVTIKIKDNATIKEVLSVNTVDLKACLKRAIIKDIIRIEFYKIQLSGEIRLAITKIGGAKTFKDTKN